MSDYYSTAEIHPVFQTVTAHWMRQLERAKVEQGKLYRAAQALGSATSERDVLEAGVRAARSA